MDDRYELGEWIVQSRGGDISQEELARRIKVSPRTVGAWERGETNGARKHLKALERVLGPRRPVELPETQDSLTLVLKWLDEAHGALDQARDMTRRIRAVTDRQ